MTKIVSKFIGFENEEDMIGQFNITPDTLKGLRVVLAWYGYGCYDGSAFVLLQKTRGGEFYEVNASHCSCYGLEGQFDLEEVTLEDLQFRLENGSLLESTYYDEESNARVALISVLFELSDGKIVVKDKEEKKLVVEDGAVSERSTEVGVGTLMPGMPPAQPTDEVPVFVEEDEAPGNQIEILQGNIDDLEERVRELEEYETKSDNLEDENHILEESLSEATAAKEEAERRLQIALEALGVTERDLDLVENSVRPLEFLKQFGIIH